MYRSPRLTAEFHDDAEDHYREDSREDHAVTRRRCDQSLCPFKIRAIIIDPFVSSSDDPVQQRFEQAGAIPSGVRHHVLELR